jgi:hypothetical protein
VTFDQATDVYYDPYDLDVSAHPYPTHRRLRAEAPLYDNERASAFVPHDRASRGRDLEWV